MGFQKNFYLNIEQYRNWIISVFFLVFLLIGILIYRDYGLTSDTTHQKLIGEYSYNYIFHGSQELFKSVDKEYGSAFELTITYLYELFRLHTDEQIYYFRQLVIFLSFFVGTIFFYLLIKLRFKNWKIGLLGALLVILSPRIFEGAFFNSKDIPFMVFSIISLYTLFKFDEKMRMGDAIIHGAVTGYLIAIRPIGLLMVAMTGLIWLIRVIIEIKNHTIHYGRYAALLALFLGFTVLSTYLWWPWLWPNPIKNFVYAFTSFSQYTTWQGQVLYMKSLYNPTHLPWHYTSVWILITTPLIYSFYFFIGLIAIIHRLIKQRINLSDISNRQDLIIFGWFFIPLFTVAVLHSVLYSGWRHMFFVYPAMLFISALGIRSLINTVKVYFHKSIPLILLQVTLALSLLGTVISMIVYHPYEGIYYNILAGRNLKAAKVRYGLDFYGLCAKESLDYLLAHADDQYFSIFPSTSVIERSTFLLPMAERSRITWKPAFNQTDYFIEAPQELRETFYVPHNFRLFYSVTRGGVDLCTVYINR